MYYTGVMQALIAAVLSGFAGTIVQRALQSIVKKLWSKAINYACYEASLKNPGSKYSHHVELLVVYLT